LRRDEDAQQAMNGSDVVFAGYRLEQQIMADTVSATYRAISQLRSGSGRPVALRITEPLDAPEDARAAAAFFATLNRAAAVRHPALSVIRGAGEAGGRLYVATDLIAGVTLAEYLHHQGPLPAADAVALLLPIADALDHAHATGLVHGAISPRTIQLPRHGAGSELPAAVLTGFGLETLLAHRVRADRNDIDVMDVCYVAPEQLRGSWLQETSGGGPSDQYALACALYHCVAGRPPFVSDTVAAMFGAHLFSTAHVPAGRDGDGALAAALAAGMAKHPEDRHESCLALVHAAGHGASPDRRVPAGAVPRAAGGPSRHETTRGRTAPPDRRGARRRRHMRRRSRRLPIAWPIAVMLVLAGMVFTLLLATILDGGGLVDPVGGLR
jgi:serine/threonine-protein kinase